MKKIVRILNWVTEVCAILGGCCCLIFALLANEFYKNDISKIDINIIILSLLAFTIIPSFIYALIIGIHILKCPNYNYHNRKFSNMIFSICAMHYLALIVSYIVLSIYHTNYIWAICIPVFIILFIMDMVSITYLDCVFE